MRRNLVNQTNLFYTPLFSYTLWLLFAVSYSRNGTLDPLLENTRLGVHRHWSARRQIASGSTCTRSQGALLVSGLRVGPTAFDLSAPATHARAGHFLSHSKRSARNSSRRFVHRFRGLSTGPCDSMLAEHASSMLTWILVRRLLAGYG